MTAVCPVRARVRLAPGTRTYNSCQEPICFCLFTKSRNYCRLTPWFL